MNTLKKYWAVIITMLFMTLISCASFFAGYKAGELHNTVKWPDGGSIVKFDRMVIGNSLILDSPIIYDGIDTISISRGTVQYLSTDGSFKLTKSDSKTTKVVDLSKYVDTIDMTKPNVLIGDMDNGLKFEQDTFYVDTTETTKEDSWFERTFDMPSTIDLTPYLKELREEYKDTALIGSINIHAYPIESFKKYTAFKEYEDSTGTYKIKYVYGGGGWTPATTNGQSHYNATITVYRLFPETGYQPLAEFDGTYVERGCFEDHPKDWVSKALNK